MLDSLFVDPKFTPAWAEHVNWGDIVSFRFPVRQLGEEAVPCKKRPCLVLDRTERLGQIFLLLCYGTTVPADRASGYDITLWDPAAALAAGLHRPTRFVGARRLLVPLTHRGFAPSKATGSPIIGALDGPVIERMNRVRARIFAEADIAAEARRQRRGMRRIRTDGPIVEVRRPKRLTR